MGGVAGIESTYRFLLFPSGPYCFFLFSGWVTDYNCFILSRSHSRTFNAQLQFASTYLELLAYNAVTGDLRPSTAGNITVLSAIYRYATLKALLFQHSPFLCET